MLDALPPPAVYEEAPDWVRTRSGLLIPQRPSKAILPGMAPLPGLMSGGFGQAQMAPTPVPTASVGAINTAGLGTANPAVGTSAAFAVDANSEILVWAFHRTNILNDPGTSVTTVTDNQGGTYTLIGTPQTVSYNNAGTISTLRGGLFRRTTPTPTAFASIAVTMSTAWTGSNSSSFQSAYIFELKNPAALPVHIEERFTTPGQVNVTPITLTNTGDIFALDFFVGGGAVVAESAQSGFTSIAGSTAFVSSQVRLQCWASNLQAQNPARTMAINATLGGAASSFACYFDVKRSAPARTWSLTELNKQNTFANSITMTVNIGTPAPDRQVIIYVGGSANTSSAVNFTAITSSGTPVPFTLATPATATNNVGIVYHALVPNGTTLTFTGTGTGAPFWIVNVFVLYGCQFIGRNEKGATVAGAGEVGPGYSYAASNSQNSPFAWVSTRYLAKGAIALGGGGSRGAVTGITTTNPNSWTSAGTGHGYAMPAYRENNSGADELTNSYGIGYSGTIAVHLSVAAFGP